MKLAPCSANTAHTTVKYLGFPLDIVVSVVSVASAAVTAENMLYLSYWTVVCEVSIWLYLS